MLVSSARGSSRANSPIVGVILFVGVAVLVTVAAYYLPIGFDGLSASPGEYESHADVDPVYEELVVRHGGGTDHHLDDMAIHIQTESGSVIIEDINPTTGEFTAQGETALLDGNSVTGTYTEADSEAVEPSETLAIPLDAGQFSSDEEVTVSLATGDQQHLRSRTTLMVPDPEFELGRAIVVDNTDSDTYDSIQAAVNDASAGAYIFVAEGTGTYNEGGLTIDKDVTVKTSTGVTVADTASCSAVTCAVHLVAQGAEFDGFTVDAGGQTGIEAAADQVTVRNTIVSNASGGTGVYSVDAADLSVTNSRVEESEDAVYLTGVVDDTTLDGNILRATNTTVRLPDDALRVNITDNTMTGGTAGINGTSGDHIYLRYNRLRGFDTAIEFYTEDDFPAESHIFDEIHMIHVSENVITDHSDTGILIARSNETEVINNTVVHGSDTSTAVWLDDMNGPVDATGNKLRHYDQGVVVNNTNEVNLFVNWNILEPEYSDSGPSIASRDSDSVDGTNNWWGSSSGPTSDDTEGPVSTDPYLDERPDAGAKDE